MGCHIYAYDKRGKEISIPWLRIPAVCYDQKFTTPETAMDFLQVLRNKSGTCPETDPTVTKICCTFPCAFSHRACNDGWDKVWDEYLDAIEAFIMSNEFGELRTG